MECKCKSPAPGCKHAQLKVIGYYCNLVNPIQSIEEIGKLKCHQKFSFFKTPFNIHTCLGIFEDKVKYIDSDNWIRSTDNLTRKVNKV